MPKHYPPGFHPPLGFHNFPKDQRQRIIDMYESKMSSLKSTMRKENAARQRLDTPRTARAKSMLAEEEEEAALDEMLKEEARKEEARKRAESSFQRLRDDTPWKAEGQSILSKKD